ncbi:MAG: hypothetical protein ACYC36_15275 [Bellilinea sp.]
MGLFSRKKNASDEFKKFDGVIEAVRRGTDGEINTARYYERRGPTWSDHLLINREDLVKRVKKGEKFIVGERQPYLGGTFSLISPVHLTGNGGKEKLVTANSPDGKVEIKEAPLF